MYTKNAKKKIENMPLQERIAYGYKKVIMLMLISGLLSIIAIGVLLADLLNYVQKINASDIAVKMCRVNVNAAARNIREMALDDDEASYDDYEKTITKLLADVDSQLKIIKETGVVSEENYTGYEGYDVPTVQSLGYDIVFRTCNFIMTKADVAPEDVAAIHQAILDYSETEEFKDLAKNANYTPYLEDGETVKQIILDTADLCKEAYDKYYAQ